MPLNPTQCKARLLAVRLGEGCNNATRAVRKKKPRG
jgi:hypothetical protein